MAKLSFIGRRITTVKWNNILELVDLELFGGLFFVFLQQVPDGLFKQIIGASIQCGRKNFQIANQIRFERGIVVFPGCFHGNFIS